MNTQKPELMFQSSTDLHLQLHSIFPTIQGEGIFAGEPATFVRLTGCNLKCPSCDTDYTSKRELVSASEVLERVNKVTSPNRIVVITGGEPFRQNLSILVPMLVENNYRVQIETNGTLPPTYDAAKLHLNTWIMCSPKVGRIHPELAPHVTAYKYVISHLHVDIRDGLPTRVLDLKVFPARPPVEHERLIFVQPMDSKDAAVNFKNLEACKFSAMTHGHCLCLQIHKLIDVE